MDYNLLNKKKHLRRNEMKWSMALGSRDITLNTKACNGMEWNSCVLIDFQGGTLNVVEWP